jgi:zinc protease
LNPINFEPRLRHSTVGKTTHFRFKDRSGVIRAVPAADISKMAMPELRVGTIDGVTAVWAPSDGLCSAGIVFRVGQIDESLRRRGWTHLIEHLALNHLANESFGFNGFTSWCTTSFVAHGTDAEMGRFLEGVAHHLTSLPFERLDHEAKVLETEHCQRGIAPTSNVMMNIFGAQGPGVFAYPEFGLRSVNQEMLDKWRAHFFTKSNAYIWFSGPTPPPAIKLDLPIGTGISSPVPNFTPIEALPAWVNVGASHVSVTASMNDTPALGATLRVVERRLTERLRHDAALSYSVSSGRMTYGANRDMVFLTADHRDGDAEAVQAMILTGLRGLQKSPATRAEIDAWAVSLVRLYEFERSAPASVAAAWCEAHLVGSTPHTAAQIIAGANAVTPDDVDQCVRQLLGAGAWGMPFGSHISDSRIRPVNVVSDWRADGEMFLRNLDLHERGGRSALFVNNEGLSLVWSGREQASIRFRELAVVDLSENGISLIDRSGFCVNVDPSTWRAGSRLAADVLTRCPPEVIVGSSASLKQAAPESESHGHDVLLTTESIDNWIALDATDTGTKSATIKLPAATPAVTSVGPLVSNRKKAITVSMTSREAIIARTAALGPHGVLVAVAMFAIAGILSLWWLGALFAVVIATLVFVMRANPIRPIQTVPEGVRVRCATAELADQIRRQALVSAWKASDVDPIPVHVKSNEFFKLASISPQATAIVNAVSVDSAPKFLTALRAASPDDQVLALLEIADHPGGPERLLMLASDLGDTSIGNTVRGFVAIDAGAKARGQGWGDTVSQGAARTFMNCLRDAEKLFQRASLQDARNVACRIGLIANARGLEIPLAERKLRYEAATKLDPDSFTAAAQHLQNMAPKWGGNNDEMLAFGRDLLDRFGPSHPLAGVSAMAHLESIVGNATGSAAKIAKEQTAIRRQIVQGLALASTTQPSSAQLIAALNMATATVWAHQEQVLVDKGFETLQGRLTAMPWSYFPDGPRPATSKPQKVDIASLPRESQRWQPTLPTRRARMSTGIGSVVPIALIALRVLRAYGRTKSGN